MENMVSPTFWRGKRVFVTGHTGFKGGWLSLWLSKLGAQVHGYSLAAPTQPNFFESTHLSKVVASSTIADIRDIEALKKSMLAVRPEIVFHLAAQPLVRQSYANPAETYSTNVMGTVNLLEAVRLTPSAQTVVVVTSDKCYENREWDWGYRENDPMGGFDPYSSSKGCAELICSAYRNSFFSTRNNNDGVSITSARAGNVIGGGDWAQDRLIPDFFRALQTQSTLQVRSPNSVRPWQHVLEPLAGYIRLAELQTQDRNSYADSWNFGPLERDTQTVGWVLNQLSQHCPDASIIHAATENLHEAKLLKLDSSKARSRLGWLPRWHIGYALQQTTAWYLSHAQGDDMHLLSLAQIAHYETSEPMSAVQVVSV